MDRGPQEAFLLEALRAAMRRVDDPDWSPTASMAEAVFWVVAADERIRVGSRPCELDWRAADADRANLLDGLRYARNNYAHDLVIWRQATHGDVTAYLHSRIGGWRWVEPPYPPHGVPLLHDAYVHRLVGRDVADTLVDAYRGFETLWPSAT